jgi:hypothetical protein
MHNSFSVCLFQFSTCFEQPHAYHQENQLYQYNIWYVVLFVPNLHARWSPTQSDTHTRCCIDTIDSPGDEHEVARNM